MAKQKKERTGTVQAGYTVLTKKGVAHPGAIIKPSDLSRKHNEFNNLLNLKKIKLQKEDGSDQITIDESDSENKKESEMTLEIIQTEYSEIYNQIAEKGAEIERNRIKALIIAGKDSGKQDYILDVLLPEAIEGKSGTDLEKEFLQQLATPTPQAAEALKKLGVTQDEADSGTEAKTDSDTKTDSGTEKPPFGGAKRKKKK